MFKGRSILRTYEEGKNTSEALAGTISRAEKETMDFHSFVQDYIAGQGTGRSLPSRSDDTLTVARAEPSLYLCVLTPGETLGQTIANWEEILAESVTQDRDMIRQEGDPNRLHRSMENEVQAMTAHLQKVRGSSKHFHEFNEKQLTESIVLFADRDRALV